ncbi:MAG: serine hydrolase domain-containing protein [Paracoccaceae bacterium]|jgi:hypothetical protein
MRVFGKWLGRILLFILVAAIAVGIWKKDEIHRLLTVNSLFDEDTIVYNFSHMNAAFLYTDLPRGPGPVSALGKGAPLAAPADMDAWIKERAVTSLLVMQDGQIRHEEYYLGTTPDDRRISFSIAKSYLSALFGIVMQEGAIASLNDPVTKYAPELKGSAYEEASIRNVLNMASGVVFDEDYLDYDSDINKMSRTLALGGKMDDFAAGLTESFVAPGEEWQYVSIDTHIISMVIRGATGRSISDLLSEKILSKLGMEQDGYYLTDGVGVAFVLGGLNFTTRDFARFGQMILQDGMYQGHQIVPSDWIAQSTQPSAPTADGKIKYGYQWWIPVGAHEGEFMGRGIYGQYLYFDTSRNLLITTTGADRKFRDDGVSEENVEMFRKIAKSL